MPRPTPGERYVRERIRENAELPTASERRALRMARGLSEADIARAVDVSPRAVCHWEAGTRRPSGERLTRYLRVLRALRGAEAPPDVAKAA